MNHNCNMFENDGGCMHVYKPSQTRAGIPAKVSCSLVMQNGEVHRSTDPLLYDSGYPRWSIPHENPNRKQWVHENLPMRGAGCTQQATNKWRLLAGKKQVPNHVKQDPKSTDASHSFALVYGGLAKVNSSTPTIEIKLLRKPGNPGSWVHPTFGLTNHWLIKHHRVVAEAIGGSWWVNHLVAPTGDQPLRRRTAAESPRGISEVVLEQQLRNPWASAAIGWMPKQTRSVCEEIHQ